MFGATMGKRGFGSCVIIVGCLTMAAQAVAQSDADVMTARELAQQGIQSFDAAEYETAAEKLGQAYRIVKFPTIALYRARALVQLGQLVEAAELYQQATLLDPGSGQRQTQEEAQETARQERDQLLPRIPKVTVTVVGAAGEPTLTVDGQSVLAVSLGAGYALNPGQHVIAAQVGERRAEETITVAEGDQRSLTLDLALPATTAGGEGGDDRKTGSGQRIAGWSALGVGGAALLVGGFSGGMALSKQKQLRDDGCLSSGACYDDQQTEIDAYDRRAKTSYVGFIAGGVLTATGVALLVTAPKQSGSSERAVSAWVGLTSAGLSGRF